MTAPHRKKVVFSANASWNILNFRLGIVRSLIESGHDVVVLAPIDATSDLLVEIGCRHIPLPMDNTGTSPFHDLLLLVRFWRLLRRERPDAFLGFTIKPNIYGSLAAHAASIPVINNISGLGAAFNNRWLNRVVNFLYRIAHRRSRTVFFQNEEDLSQLVDQNIVDRRQTALLPGSGIDLLRFTPTTNAGRATRESFSFILVARLLWAKGIGEYVEAARLVRRLYPDTRFRLLGFVEKEGTAAVDAASVRAWADEGIVDYLGSAEDVRPHIAKADCVVLPSYYREGTPRVLLEAAAMAKPIITTDWIGCRNAVDHGRNGLLCRVRDADDLAHCMLEMMRLPDERRAAMGCQSRQKAEQQFDERIVVDRYLAALKTLR